MEHTFYKYHGAGNDFIIVDNRDMHFPADNISYIEWLCDRRFGIGADGLMLLQNAVNYDFEMRYFNSDGREASMCGNGGRCIVAFAHRLGIVGEHSSFIAVDGPHEAFLKPDGDVSLKMSDVKPGGYCRQ
jgi:diaminopimelate epimerase